MHTSPCVHAVEFSGRRTAVRARGGLPGGQNLDDMLAKMESLRETISEVNTQFKNADMTTFVCVCIPEFLSLYETERMIQELASYGIDTHCIVVNQLLYPRRDSVCEQCNARRRMQKKYLDQIEELYDEFNVVKMPLLVEEVRGKEKLERFSEMLKTGQAMACVQWCVSVDSRRLDAQDAQNPTRIGKNFGETALRHVVDLIGRRCDTLLQIVNYNIEGQQYVVAGENIALQTMGNVLNFVSRRR